MPDIKRLRTPLTADDIKTLKAGEQVLLTGKVYTARDMAHKILCQAIEQGKTLPFDLSGAVIYFTGPTPARPSRVIGSVGPTTSSRMDAFSPLLIEKGIKAMIGKGYRSQTVIDALKKCGAVHFAAIGGAGALLSKHIVSAKVIAYEQLATEAVRELELVDFPLFVAYDSTGRTIYKQK